MVVHKTPGVFSGEGGRWVFFSPGGWVSPFSGRKQRKNCQGFLCGGWVPPFSGRKRRKNTARVFYQEGLRFLPENGEKSLPGFFSVFWQKMLKKPCQGVFSGRGFLHFFLLGVSLGDFSGFFLGGFLSQSYIHHANVPNVSTASFAF